jgi:hypothetical protein
MARFIHEDGRTRLRRHGGEENRAQNSLDLFNVRVATRLIKENNGKINES